MQSKGSTQTEPRRHLMFAEKELFDKAYIVSSSTYECCCYLSNQQSHFLWTSQFKMNERKRMCMGVRIYESII